MLDHALAAAAHELSLHPHDPRALAVCDLLLHWAARAPQVRSRMMPSQQQRARALEWLVRCSWSVTRDHGDALLVFRLPSGVSAGMGAARVAGSAMACTHGDDLPPEVDSLVPLAGMPHEQPVRVTRRARGLRGHRRPDAQANDVHRALGASVGTFRSLYSFPPPGKETDELGLRRREFGADGTHAKVRVSNWQAGTCKVFPPDVERFCALSALGRGCAAIRNASLPANNATAACIEADLDSEMVATAAADAVVNVAGANNGSSFLSWAVSWFNQGSAASPSIASVSWGGFEQPTAPASNSSNVRLNVEFQKLGVLGKAIFWASGDWGANGPPRKIRNTTDSFDCIPNGTFSPSFPATSPFVTACAGTELHAAPGAPPTPVQQPPICHTQLPGCFPADGAQERATSVKTAGFTSGGGFSWWFTPPPWQAAEVHAYLNTTPAAHLPPPRFWNRAGRGVPDVSALAGDVIVCSNTQVWLGGGTSAAAPFWAGVWALATRIAASITGKPLGPASPLLYHISRQSRCFRDITQGDNRCPFGPKWMGQTCDCATCHGFEAAKGWDPVTGIGTPNVTCILDFIRTMLTNKSASHAG